MLSQVTHLSLYNASLRNQIYCHSLSNQIDNDLLCQNILREWNQVTVVKILKGSHTHVKTRFPCQIDGQVLIQLQMEVLRSVRLKKSFSNSQVLINTHLHNWAQFINSQSNLTSNHCLNQRKQQSTQYLLLLHAKYRYLLKTNISLVKSQILSLFYLNE